MEIRNLYKVLERYVSKDRDSDGRIAFRSVLGKSVEK